MPSTTEEVRNSLEQSQNAKYNAAFVRCVDVMSQMLQKYGHQVLDKLEQDAPQKVEQSEESNQAQPLTDKAA